MFSAPIKGRPSSNVYFHNYTQEESQRKSLTDNSVMHIACLEKGTTHCTNERKTSPKDMTIWDHAADVTGHILSIVKESRWLERM